MTVSNISTFFEKIWNACPSRSAFCPDAQTSTKVAQYIRDFKPADCLSSLKSSKWTFVVLTGTAFVACLYKIYKLRVENKKLDMELKRLRATPNLSLAESIILPQNASLVQYPALAFALKTLIDSFVNLTEDSAAKNRKVPTRLIKPLVEEWNKLSADQQAQILPVSNTLPT